MIFDCLYVNGHSLRNRPLEDRQAVLWELQHALQTDAVKLTEGFPVAKNQRFSPVGIEPSGGRGGAGSARQARSTTALAALTQSGE
jgi:hypothetical protein